MATRSSRELCHEWANQTRPNGKAGSVFFEGTKIYSYGHHFEMARIVKPNVIIVTTKRYSNTTAKHLSWVRGAIPHHFDSFELPSFEDHKGNVAYMVATITEAFKEAARARKNAEFHLERIVESAKEIRRYAELFKVKILKAQEAIIVQAENAMSEDALQEVRAKEKERQEKILEANKKEINEWLNCQRTSISRNIKKVFLRINCSKPEMVETSLGVNVTKQEARVLYMAMKAGKPVHGFNIGGYTVNSYKAGTLTVGCHKITEDEINRFASLQGWRG